MISLKLINVKGDLFATAASFFGQALIKFGSSMVLTRVLRPEDYGIVTILMSILFVIEMLADIGINLFVIRDKNGEDPRYLNNAWTLRFCRSLANCAIVLVSAPLIATKIYHAPELTTPLRVISLTFVISGLESMSFPLAIRRKRSRIVMYSELAVTFLSTSFALVACYFSRDYWGILYSTLFGRGLMAIVSHLVFRDMRPRFEFDWQIARQIFRFTKFSMPSSMLTLGLSQFDKIVFLRLFDLQRLGVYGLANSFAAPVEALIAKISQTVLYPRCAHNFRTDPATLSARYYRENTTLFASMLILPALIGGAAHLLIAALYPARYALAGEVLQAFMVRAALFSLASPAEDLLIAAGEFRVILVGNIFRALWLVGASLGGYFVFGFLGFVYGTALSGLPPLAYYFWLQRKKGMLVARYEFYKVAFICCVAISAYLGSELVRLAWPAAGLGLRR
jgi:lipopolysaccharide exporter